MTKLVRAQLIIFSILTVVGLVAMATVYVKLPAMFGIGRYHVTVALPATGGLYPHANVAYRGTNVGVVQEVRLTPAGVNAELSIDSDYRIPADVEAWVRSVSAVGEQYVDLVPRSAEGPLLADGDVVTRSQLPQDVGAMLDQADRLLASVKDTRLQALIDEAFRAFNGAGPDLQRFIDSAALLVQAADENSEQTKILIDQIGPLLETQTRGADDVRAWTRDLAIVTDQLRQHDPALRGVLRQGPPAIARATELFAQVQPTLPLVLSNLVSVGQVSTIYLAGIEQILVVFPPLIAALQTAIRGPREYGAIVNFQLEVNDPPACTTGFLPPDQRRFSTDYRPIETPGDLYCKVPQNAVEAVRGIRNTPCMEVPGKRAPTPEICRDPQGYVPLGNNPPFGPPQPVAPAAYTPGDGKYVAPDGRVFRQGDVGPDGSGVVPASWQSMMTEQQR